MYRVDNQSRQAVYEQITQQVERYVLTGVLGGGDKLPSVRRMSTDLAVNPNTVQRAYTELERAGVIVTAPGRGAFVNDKGITTLRERRREMFLSEFKALVAQLKLSGLDKQQIISVVERAYQEDNHD